MLQKLIDSTSSTNSSRPGGTCICHNAAYCHLAADWTLDIASLFMICRWLIRISDLLRSLCHGRIMEKVDFLSLVKRGSMMNLPLFMKNYQSMLPHKSGSGPCEYKASIFGLFRLNLSLDPAALIKLGMNTKEGSVRSD